MTAGPDSSDDLDTLDKKDSKEGSSTTSEPLSLWNTLPGLLVILALAFGIIFGVGNGYDSFQKWSSKQRLAAGSDSETSMPTVSTNERHIQPRLPGSPDTTTKQALPPDLIRPYIHDGIAQRISRWESEDLPTNSHRSVRGYGNNNDLINWIEIYFDHGDAKLFEQFIVVYDDEKNNTVITVKHYAPDWQSGVNKDPSLITDKGDYFTSQTIYSYSRINDHLYLNTVRRTDAKGQNPDELTFKRDASNQLQSVLRNNEPLNLIANRNVLSGGAFDLWIKYGQDK